MYSVPRQRDRTASEAEIWLGEDSCQLHMRSVTVSKCTSARVGALAGIPGVWDVFVCLCASAQIRAYLSRTLVGYVRIDMPRRMGSTWA